VRVLLEHQEVWRQQEVLHQEEQLELIVIELIEQVEVQELHLDIIRHLEVVVVISIIAILLREVVRIEVEILPLEQDLVLVLE